MVLHNGVVVNPVKENIWFFSINLSGEDPSSINNIDPFKKNSNIQSDIPWRILGWADEFFFSVGWWEHGAVQAKTPTLSPEISIN